MQNQESIVRALEYLLKAAKQGEILSVQASELVPAYGRPILRLEIEPVRAISLWDAIEQG